MQRCRGARRWGAGHLCGNSTSFPGGPWVSRTTPFCWSHWTSGRCRRARSTPRTRAFGPCSRRCKQPTRCSGARGIGCTWRPTCPPRFTGFGRRRGPSQQTAHPSSCGRQTRRPGYFWRPTSSGFRVACTGWWTAASTGHRCRPTLGHRGRGPCGDCVARPGKGGKQPGLLRSPWRPSTAWAHTSRSTGAGVSGDGVGCFPAARVPGPRPDVAGRLRHFGHRTALLDCLVARPDRNARRGGAAHWPSRRRGKQPGTAACGLPAPRDSAPTPPPPPCAARSWPVFRTHPRTVFRTHAWPGPPRHYTRGGSNMDAHQAGHLRPPGCHEHGCYRTGSHHRVERGNFSET